jgi:hypothetical protein
MQERNNHSVHVGFSFAVCWMYIPYIEGKRNNVISFSGPSVISEIAGAVLALLV